MPDKSESLEALLIKHGRKPNSPLAAQNFAAFLEHWDEIQNAYEKGWSYSDIWKTLREEGRIDFSYASFTSFTRKMKKRREKAEAERRGAKPVAAARIRDEPNPHKPGLAKGELPTFGDAAKRRGDKYF
jgi:hypothetical protein